MKKREFVKRLRAIAADADLELEFIRQGATHELWSLGWAASHDPATSGDQRTHRARHHHDRTGGDPG